MAAAPTAGQVAAVVGITLACTAAVFALIDYWRAWLLADRARICWVSIAWVSLCFGLITGLALTQSDPARGLLTTTSWYSAGWQNGLSIFGIRINTWYAYTALVNYQIIRSILGSLISNFFRSYLLVKVQASGAGSSPGNRPSAAKLVAAQAAYDIVVFYYSVSDTMLLLAAADMTLITLAATVMADSVSTLYFCWQPVDGELVESAAKNAALATATEILPSRRKQHRHHVTGCHI